MVLAGGDLEQPGLGGGGAGERAALVAEELALEQRVGERGAVDRDEAAGAPGELVQGAREDLLARPGLAADEHVHHALRDAGDHLGDPLRRRIGDGDGGEERRVGRGVQGRLEHHRDERPELEALAGANLHPGARGDALAADANAVGAAQILDLERRSAVDAGVAARDLGMVERHLAVGVASEDHARPVGERMGEDVPLAGHEHEAPRAGL